MWNTPQGMGWWMLLGGIWVIVFWGAMIALIVWGVKKLGEPEKGDSSPSSALDIAKARYARGEISREEFEQLKNDIS